MAQQGTLDVLHCDKIGERCEYQHWLKTATELMELKLPKRHQQRAWRIGVKVRVSGKRTAGTNEVHTMQALALAAPASTVGPRKTIVLLINYQDNRTKPWTATQINQVFAGVDGFYRENSFNTASIEGLIAGSSVDIYGWYISCFPVNGDCGTATGAASDAYVANTLGGCQSQHLSACRPDIPA